MSGNKGKYSLQAAKADGGRYPIQLLEKWQGLEPDERERAEMCYCLVIGGYKDLSPATIQDCFRLQTPSVGAVAHYIGEEDAAQLVAEIIAMATALINVGKSIRREQVGPIAALIVSMPEFRLFSVADFRLAINRGVTGQYGKLFDSFDITTVCTWLRAYWEERMLQAESAAAIAQAAESASAKFMPEWFLEYLRESKAKAEQKERERREIQAKADEVFAEWESEVFETVMVNQWTKTVRVQVQEVDEKTGKTSPVWKSAEMICDESDPDKSMLAAHPIRRYKPGGVERDMKRHIYEYVAFCDAGKTNELYNQFKDEVFRRYESPDYLEAESKAALINIATLRRELPAAKILENFLNGNASLTPQQRAAHLRYTLEAWEDQYYTEYLPKCIRRKIPALKLSEMLWADALAAWVENGNKNPVIPHIFND